MNVNRGTGVSTAVTISHFCILQSFTLINNIILQNKVYTKCICSLIKVPTKKKNKNGCFIIISIPGNVHYLYARAKISGEGRVYFGTSLPSFE